jgi:hypothetical protein
MSAADRELHVPLEVFGKIVLGMVIYQIRWPNGIAWASTDVEARKKRAAIFTEQMRQWEAPASPGYIKPKWGKPQLERIEINPITVPTMKDDLIAWLNKNFGKG